MRRVKLLEMLAAVGWIAYLAARAWRAVLGLETVRQLRWPGLKTRPQHGETRPQHSGGRRPWRPAPPLLATRYPRHRPTGSWELGFGGWGRDTDRVSSRLTTACRFTTSPATPPAARSPPHATRHPSVVGPLRSDPGRLIPEVARAVPNACPGQPQVAVFVLTFHRPSPRLACAVFSAKGASEAAPA